MFRYLVTLVIFTLVLAGVLYGVQSSRPEWVGVVVVDAGIFFLLTAAFHWGLVAASKGNPQAFIRYYMGATSFKLLIHLGVLVGPYAFFTGEHVVRFIVTFLFGYVLFTGL